MTLIVQAGISAESVTSSTEVDLLALSGASASSDGVAIANTHAWSLVVSTNHDVTVKVYLKVGANAGLQLISGWTAVAGSAAPYSLLFDGLQSAERIRVTAKAVSTTATVNCDFAAVSP